jgi:hypothetical protein
VYIFLQGLPPSGPSPRLLLIITDSGVRTSLEEIEGDLTMFCIHYGRVIYFALNVKRLCIK